MSEATVQGVVHLVEETKTYGQKGFRKRLVVLEQENGRFTNYIPVEFVQDNCDVADDIAKGENIEITYKLNGRRWQKDPGSEVKFFLNAEAIRFKKLAGAAAASSESQVASGEEEPPVYEDGDIPF